MGHKSLSADARLACVDHANRALRRSSLLGLPASVLFAAILGNSVPLATRITFVALVWTADLLAFFTSGAYLRRRARGEKVERYWLGPVCIGFVGFAWSSLSFLGLPGTQHTDLRAVYLLFVCATSATYVVGTAACRSYFYASQLPMVVPITFVYASSADRTSRLLGFAVPIYFVVMAGLHREVHGVVVSELELREQNSAANAELRSVNKRLSLQALHDELTGLANRASFMENLERAVSGAARNRKPIAVIYIDLDWFKVVNDTLGHANGDALLVAVANRMRHFARTSDVIARYGGDEFTVLCTDLHEHREAVVIAERIANGFAHPFPIGGQSLHVSASIGVATNAHPTDNADTLLSHADAAQYQAKQHGRNRVHVFDQELQREFFRRLNDEQELRDALADGQIRAAYQPIVDLATGRVTSAEALARWQHPTRGFLDAFKFVPLAEAGGLILNVDDSVTRDAVWTCAALPPDALGPHFRVWVNVSAKQFTRVHPAERFAELLESVGCDPRMIGFELTETAVLHDLDAAAKEITTARELGIKVALDDFGVGHSSLTLLRSLPLDKVKIDRAFIANIGHNGKDHAIVESVLSLANTLGLEVVAEGVETPEQARLLHEMGCRSGQGWLWAKALPIDDLVEYVRAANSTARLAIPGNSEAAIARVDHEGESTVQG